MSWASQRTPIEGPVHQPDDAIAGAGRTAATFSTTAHRARRFTTGGTGPQKYGMDAVADVSDGVESEANAHEGVET
jgi:hypothetical protein